MVNNKVDLCSEKADIAANISISRRNRPMANIVSFGAIHEKVLKYKDDFELPHLGDAFQWLALETIMGLNESEIEDAITDGPMDGSIDAVYITGKDVHIFNFRYAETFPNSQKNFPEDEINNLILTMKSIYAQSINKNDINEAVWEKIQLIWDLSQKGILNFKYHICSNKEKPVEHARRKLETELDQYKYVEFFYYNQDDLITKILERKYRKVNGEIRFSAQQYFDRSDGGLKGIIATVGAVDLLNLVRDPDEPKRLNEDAFNDNVRIYLRRTDNVVNQGIYESAISEQNSLFWYLNNGVTIVCEACEYTPGQHNPLVRLTNFQIVNGGQTTHALHEARQKDEAKLNKVVLLLRICETRKDYEISERISETTNKQTPVRTRDLHANDRIQKQLEEQFDILGYCYERKKNQHEEKPRNKRLNNELLAQLYMAYYLDKPSEARDQKAVVFDEQYDDIFDNTKISARKMLIPYKVFLPLEKMKKEIQAKKRRKESIDEREAFISRAIFHLLNTVKYISEKEGLQFEDDETLIPRAIEKAITYVGEIVQEEREKRGELYTHDKFFKEVPTNALIKKHVLGKYPPVGK